MNMEEKTAALNRQFAGTSPEELLSWFIKEYKGKITFSTSLGVEDQVITHMIASIDRNVRIFTLDTGRLFQETYDLIEITRKKYGISIEVFFPDATRVEEMVNTRGVNLFYESIENRRLCCHIRKKEPLARALAGMEVWITGMRRDQSVTRTETPMIEWDPSLEIIKVNPLISWNDEMTWEYIREQKIPVNELHQKGFPSIGCLPCTRQVNPGEDLRSGRWWWELPQFKECGLHTKL
jgi:phosphoadenosine phosphosulfate reductase